MTKYGISEDRRRAFADLVDRVAVTEESDPVAFRRVKRHQGELRDWFATRTAWPLVLRRSFARLVKTPSATLPGAVLPMLSGPRDYEILAWILWFGEKEPGGQFVLSDMLAEIEAQANLAGGARRLDWNEASHRASLKRAAKTLEDLGVLIREDGDLERYVRDAEGDVLYGFSDLSRYLHVNLSDALYRDLVHRGDASALSQPAPRGTGPEQRLYRSLLLTSGLDCTDDPEAFAVLRGRDRRQRISDDFASAFGWDLEVTGSYASLLRPADSRQATTFPGQGSATHLVLLLTGRLRELVAQGALPVDVDERVAISEVRLESEVHFLQAEFGSLWAKAYAERTAADLASQAIEEMRFWGFAQGPDEHGQYVILPMAARFAGFYTEDGDGLEHGESG